jgi:hypothetical protein
MSKPKFMERFKQSGFAEFVRDKVKPVAGDVLDIIGDVTGIEAVERVGEMLNKRKETDEAAKALAAELEMKKLEWEMELVQIRVNQDLEQMRMENEDRASARTRQIENLKTTGKRDWLMGAVVITGLTLMVGIIACLVFVKIPEPNQRLADMTFGSVLSIGTSIFAYYVGSSRGSHQKQQTIDRITK